MDDYKIAKLKTYFGILWADLVKSFIAGPPHSTTLYLKQVWEISDIVDSTTSRVLNISSWFLGKGCKALLNPKLTYLAYNKHENTLKFV